MPRSALRTPPDPTTKTIFETTAVPRARAINAACPIPESHRAPVGARGSRELERTIFGGYSVAVLLLATTHMDEDGPRNHEADPLARATGANHITRGLTRMGQTRPRTGPDQGGHKYHSRERTLVSGQLNRQLKLAWPT